MKKPARQAGRRRTYKKLLDVMQLEGIHAPLRLICKTGPGETTSTGDGHHGNEHVTERFQVARRFFNRHPQLCSDPRLDRTSETDLSKGIIAGEINLIAESQIMIQKNDLIVFFLARCANS